MKAAGINNTFLFVLHAFVFNETISQNEPFHNESRRGSTQCFVFIPYCKNKEVSHESNQIVEGALWSVPFTKAFLKYLISVQVRL